MWRGHEGIILSEEALIRRARGRRWYNSWRQFCALARQAEVAHLRREGYTNSAIAGKLGVSLRTIERDILALMRLGRHPVCPTCGRMNALPRAWFPGSNPMIAESPHGSGVTSW